jgi:hypothetical protein
VRRPRPRSKQPRDAVIEQQRVVERKHDALVDPIHLNSRVDAFGCRRQLCRDAGFAERVRRGSDRNGDA